MHFCLLFFDISASEHKEALADIVEANEKALTYDAEDVVKQLFLHIREYPLEQRNRRIVREEITTRDIDHKADGTRCGMLLTVEGEEAVEKIAQYARQDDIRSGGNLIAQVEQIEANNGDSVAEKSIHHADKHEFQKGYIKKLFQKIFHNCSDTSFFVL